jgi:hypothetical protein
MTPEFKVGQYVTIINTQNAILEDRRAVIADINYAVSAHNSHQYMMQKNKRVRVQILTGKREGGFVVLEQNQIVLDDNPA